MATKDRKKLTRLEAQEQLDCSYETLRRYRNTGVVRMVDGKAMRLKLQARHRGVNDGVMFFYEDDVQNFLAFLDKPVVPR